MYVHNSGVVKWVSTINELKLNRIELVFCHHENNSFSIIGLKVSYGYDETIDKLCTLYLVML